MTEASEVAAAVARARMAQGAWAALSPRARARRLVALRRVLVERLDDIVEVVQAETGKPRLEGLAHEVLIVANLLRTYERRAPALLAPRRVGSGLLVTKSGTKFYEPYGVIGVISPWNFPFSLPAIPTVSALFAGNAVVLKPSEVTPRSGALLGELVRQALPEFPDLVQVVEGAGEVGAALVRAPVDKLVFIGSEATGRRIMRDAAETLTPVLMELGSNDVAIVCEDANVERAAAGIVWGAVANAGQVCMATERALVAQAVYDPFVAAVRRELAALRLGRGPDADVGPLIAENQGGILDGIVADAEQHGARVERPGGAAGDGLYPPTLILDTSEAMLFHRTEAFGPLLPVLAVPDDAAAVRIARAGGFGLNASIWTRSRRRAERIAAALPTGSVMVNDVLANFGMSQLPYGGVGRSGFGRLQGDEGLLEFVRVKAVATSRIRFRREPFWFPYRAGTYRLARRLLGAWFAPGLAARLRALFSTDPGGRA